MAVERTLSIIKPDAVAKNVIGQIYSRFEKAGLQIIAARMAHLSRSDAEGESQGWDEHIPPSPQLKKPPIGWLFQF